MSSYEDTSFDDFCDEIESYGRDKCLKLGDESFSRVFGSLITDEDKQTFIRFIILCTTADGRLSEEERSFLTYIGLLGTNDYEIETMLGLIKGSIHDGRDWEMRKEMSGDMRRLLSHVDRRTRNDIRLCGLLAAGCDRKISESERQFIISIFGES